MADDWYRRKKWTKKDQEEFFTHLHRCHSDMDKAQYLRIQATYLEEKYPAEAIQLLTMVINEYPEQTQLAQSYLQMARCQIKLNKTESVIDYFRRALNYEQEHPSSSTRAYLEFPMYIINTVNTALYSEALGVLEKIKDRLSFIIDAYQYHSVSAIIKDYYGDREQSKKHAQVAMAEANKSHSGLRYHPKVGLVNKNDNIFQDRLKNIVG